MPCLGGPILLNRGCQQAITLNRLMGLELLLALGIPILLLVGGTLYFAARGRFPKKLKRITSRDAILWNTLLGLTIALVVVRYLTRR